jgi:hypothetical protein
MATAAYPLVNETARVSAPAERQDSEDSRPPSPVHVDCDARGRWCASSEDGQIGGIFISEGAAQWFARIESPPRVGTPRRPIASHLRVVR